jgi:hypothetical protein
VTPEEATATATFAGAVVSNPASAELITVVANGMESGNNMFFNGNVIKTNAWDAGSEAALGSMINVEHVSVTSDLVSSDNTVGFQDNDTAGMDACNAILVVGCEEAVDKPDLTIVDKTENWIDSENKTYEITYTVQNIGEVNANASTTHIQIVDGRCDSSGYLLLDSVPIQTRASFSSSSNP